MFIHLHSSSTTMRKLSFALGMLLISFCSLSAQNAFWDAILLHNAANGKFGSGIQTKTLASDFIADPFIHPYDTTLVKVIYSNLSSGGHETYSTLQSVDAHSGIGEPLLSDPSPTTLLIDGTARFLAERFREEATTLYLDRFRSALNGVPLASDLLPKTTDFLNNGNLFDLKALGTSFKEAFDEDLQSLLPNLKDHLVSSGRTSSDEYRSMVFLLDICEHLIQGTHPVDIINYLDLSYQNDPDFHNYDRIVHLVNLFQHNLRALKVSDDEPSLFGSGISPTWINLRDLRLMNTPDEFRYFLGLIYQQDTSFFNTTLGLSDTTLDARAQQFWQNEVIPFLDVLQEIELVVQKPELSVHDYAPVFDAFLGLIKWANESRLLRSAGNILPPAQIEIFEKIIDVYQSIHSKSYAHVITDGSWLIHQILLASGVTNEDATEVLEIIQQYGTFMVDIVQAENSEEVKDAIKRNVTKFSYLDKRRSPLSFTVMGQPSLLAGSEEISSGGQWREVAAVSCPIGFDLSFNKRRTSSAPGSFNPEHQLVGSTIKEPRNSVIGFYFGILDLTAPFSYRFDGNTAALPEEITFKQILSPSVMFHYGIANSPITLAFGWQHTPELRTIGGTAESVDRILFRCSWDIPLIKLGAKR